MEKNVWKALGSVKMKVGDIVIEKETGLKREIVEIDGDYIMTVDPDTGRDAWDHSPEELEEIG